MRKEKQHFGRAAHLRIMPSMFLSVMLSYLMVTSVHKIPQVNHAVIEDNFILA